MIPAIIEKVKGFILAPVETFQQSKNDKNSLVSGYFAVLLLFNAILATIISLLWIEHLPAGAGIPGLERAPLFVFFFMLAGGFFGAIIFGAWLHLWVYLFGGRKGIMLTIRAVIYGSTPRLLFGWIPFIGFLFMLWSLALGILGIREFQEIDTMKAILAMALAVMIPLILIILIAAYFFTTHMVYGVVPSPPANII
jgi:hypothetical protein